MAALTTIHYSSPTSFQLKHGRKCNKKSSSFIIYSIRTWNHNHILLRTSVSRGIRCCAVSGKKGKVSGDTNSWTNSDTSSSGDVFSGWVDTNSPDSEPEKPGGFGGGIVAAVILAAGLTFTSLYLISNRNTSAQKPEMEALSAQQEMLLSSDDQNEDEQVKTTDSTASSDEDFLGNDSSPESMAGIIMDSSSSQEITDATFERRPVDDINVGTSITQNGESTSSHTDDTNNTSSQEDTQIRSGFSDVSVPSNSSLSLPKNSESDLVSGHASASSLKDPEVDPADAVPGLITEPKDNLVPNNLNYPPVSDDASAYVSPDFQNEISVSSGTEIFDISTDLSSSSGGLIPNELDDSVKSDLVAMPSLPVDSEEVMETETALSTQEDHDLSKMVQVPKQVEGNYLNENGSTETNPQLIFSDSYTNELYMNTELGGSNPYFDSLVPENSITSSGIPAPSLVSAALQVPPGKVVVPAAVDQVQGQALAALQVLKVIEADAQPGDLCTRREYARWLVSASSALSRNSISKVYPAMYVENVTELAFDDITPEDPDFAFIQGLAEAGLISSKLSRTDMLGSSDEEQDPSLFFPESPLSRQDLVSWKMALDKRWLPDVDKKIVYQSCGFIDIDKINPDAWPALVADQSAGEQGIMALAFGYTRLFQPYKPVTKGQAAIALATGEAADIVSEELARIEAESMAETAVAAHNALVAKVEKDINASFEKELIMEREKIAAVEKMAQEARMELERLKAEREEENNSLIRGQAAVESEMQVLSSLRHEVEEQLQSLMSDKMEVSFERERINKLRKEAESENQAITRLQYELEVERKALSMARAWAEDEAKRAREQAKALEEARDRWEKHGIKVIVDDDLREDANAGVTWLTAGTQSTVDATVSRAESLVLKLKTLAGEIRGKSRFVIETIIFKITSLISSLKEWAANSARRAGELHSSLEEWAANSTRRAGELHSSLEEWAVNSTRRAGELQGAAMSKASASVQELQQGATGLSSAVKEGAKRVAEDCKDGVEKISQKFKA